MLRCSHLPQIQDDEQKLNRYQHSWLGPQYSSHGIKIGAATTVSKAGLSADQFRPLGRWRSGSWQYQNLFLGLLCNQLILTRVNSIKFGAHSLLVATDAGAPGNASSIASRAWLGCSRWTGDRSGQPNWCLSWRPRLASRVGRSPASMPRPPFRVLCGTRR